MRQHKDYYCPICKTMMGRPIAHFKKHNDVRHNAIYDSQIQLIIGLFNDLEFTKVSTMADYGVIFHYNFVKQVWEENFTQDEIKNRMKETLRLSVKKAMSKNHFKVTEETRAKMAAAKVGKTPWNKGLSTKRDGDRE